MAEILAWKGFYHRLVHAYRVVPIPDGWGSPWVGIEPLCGRVISQIADPRHTPHATLENVTCKRCLADRDFPSTALRGEREG